MKIALVILHADPSRGGAERYTVDLASALSHRGHAVSLLASTFAETLPGVEQITLSASGATRSRQYRQFLDALDRATTQTEYDVVHAMLPVRRCDVYHPHAGMAAAQMRKWNRWLNPRRVEMARVERELLLGDDPPITIALSEYVKRSIALSYTLRDDRLATLFNAVDLKRFDAETDADARLNARASLNLNSDDVAALMIAQDFERKGLREAIEAFARVEAPSLKLIVAGRDDARPFLALAGKLGVSERVEFVGPVSDPRSLYAASDFFVLPTKHDPCSLVVLEALVMGLPVISTAFNGATEIMADGAQGRILPDPGDVEALADAMRNLLDPNTRAAMRSACLALRPRLSYEHHLDGLIGIYQRAMQRH